MMKLQGTSFNLDAVKDQIAKVMKRRRSQRFGLGNIPRGHSPHDHLAMQGWSEG